MVTITCVQPDSEHASPCVYVISEGSVTVLYHERSGSIFLDSRRVWDYSQIPGISEGFMEAHQRGQIQFQMKRRRIRAYPTHTGCGQIWGLIASAFTSMHVSDMKRVEMLQARCLTIAAVLLVDHASDCIDMISRLGWCRESIHQACFTWRLRFQPGK